MKTESEPSYSEVFCKVYDAFGWGYYPEAFGEALIQWMDREQIRPRCAMDLACGTGVLCRLLHSHGIRASGMDLSQAMIALARGHDPQIPYTVADMRTFRPKERYDLVTCIGDSLNHIPSLPDLEQIFRNVFAYTAPGGYFVFDLLDVGEVSGDEPFGMELSPGERIWFRMDRDGEDRVALTVRVYEGGRLAFEEVIRERIYAPAPIREALQRAGFRVVSMDHCLPGAQGQGTTWFVVARKEDL